jgi:membrane protease YdiL (CAAX protease family)
MPFDLCAFVFKATKCGSDNESACSSYEDIGVFCLLLTVLRPILGLFVRFRLLTRWELEHPGFGLQVAVIVVLMMALYLILKVRHRRPVLRALGWVWPHTRCVMLASLLGVLLAGVAICLHGHAQNMRTIPLVEAMMLGVVFGPILEESFFRGCLLPVLAGSFTNGLAVILTALVFALFHNPVNLAQWVSFSGSGVAYGWIRVTSRSTTAAALTHAVYNLVLLLFARY